MSTRQKRNSLLARFAVPVICAALVAYFIHHAWNGRYGVEALARMDEEIIRLEYELAGIRLERERVAARVALLGEGSTERDMLDERARHFLGLASPDELIVFVEPPRNN